MVLGAIPALARLAAALPPSIALAMLAGVSNGEQADEEFLARLKLLN